MTNFSGKSAALAAFALAALVAAFVPAHARAQASAYPSMASLDRYLMPADAEISLARTAAPASVSDHAEVMVLGRDGYSTAVKGANGFVCVVERGWGAATTAPEFWNPKIRAPICFNAAAARTFLPIFLMKTRLVLAGKSKAQILQATEAAFKSTELPALEQGSMCYMLSPRQYLNDVGKSWHPHLMFFIPGDVGSSWGADLPGSPIIAANDPEEHATIMMMWASEWSDGSPAPHQSH